MVARIPFKKSRKPLTFAPLIIYNPTFSSRLLSFPPSSFVLPPSSPPSSRLPPFSSFTSPSFLLSSAYLPPSSHLPPPSFLPLSFIFSFINFPPFFHFLCLLSFLPPLLYLLSSFPSPRPPSSILFFAASFLIHSISYLLSLSPSSPFLPIMFFLLSL